VDLVDFYNKWWSEKDDSVDYKRLSLIIGRVNPGDYVLQIDCGPGMLAKKLLEKGALVKATEISQVGMERARKKGIDVVQVDLDSERLPFPDEEFDVVISDSSIEHLFYSDRILRECARVLKPGGKFILLLPNIAHWRFRLWLLFGRFPYIKNSPTDLSHIRFFTVSEARALCKREGLKVKEVDGSASVWVRGLYPWAFQIPPFKQVYTCLARLFPSLLARDFILVCEKSPF